MMKPIEQATSFVVCPITFAGDAYTLRRENVARVVRETCAEMLEAYPDISSFRDSLLITQCLGCAHLGCMPELGDPHYRMVIYAERRDGYEIPIAFFTPPSFKTPEDLIEEFLHSDTG